MSKSQRLQTDHHFSTALSSIETRIGATLTRRSRVSVAFFSRISVIEHRPAYDAPMRPLGLVTALLVLCNAAAAATAPAPVKSLKITVLVTNVAGEPWAGRGEWGFAALVEVDGRRLLYDTGASPDLVLRNAEALDIQLADIEDVILSHNHRDHTAGLLELRRELSRRNPRAMSRAHVGAGIFAPRLGADGRDYNHALAIRNDYVASGGSFVVHERAEELIPGVWLLAPVPRVHPERNWMRNAFQVETPQGRVEDTVAEDAAVAFMTADGIVLLTGCGHAGIVNISEEARRVGNGERLLSVVGGLHLYSADDKTLAWTGERLRAFGLRYLLAAHCTGMEATYRLRSDLALTRQTALVAGVGSIFELRQGISGLSLSR